MYIPFGSLPRILIDPAVWLTDEYQIEVHDQKYIYTHHAFIPGPACPVDVIRIHVFITVALLCICDFEISVGTRVSAASRSWPFKWTYILGIALEMVHPM